jgi:hypothetical protein
MTWGGGSTQLPHWLGELFHGAVARSRSSMPYQMLAAQMQPSQSHVFIVAQVFVDVHLICQVGAPGGVRTHDQGFRVPSFRPLSYERMMHYTPTAGSVLGIAVTAQVFVTL